MIVGLIDCSGLKSVLADNYFLGRYDELSDTVNSRKLLYRQYGNGMHKSGGKFSEHQPSYFSGATHEKVLAVGKAPFNFILRARSLDGPEVDQHAPIYVESS